MTYTAERHQEIKETTSKCMDALKTTIMKLTELGDPADYPSETDRAVRSLAKLGELNVDTLKSAHTAWHMVEALHDYLLITLARHEEFPHQKAGEN